MFEQIKHIWKRLKVCDLSHRIPINFFFLFVGLGYGVLLYKETITELSQIPLRELNSLIFKIYKMKN
jgi:hypothetical protein